MTRFVAFLGGINVGGHRVTMDRLRAEFEMLGHTEVSTFIASGNVLFSAPSGDHAVSIEAHLAERLGWPVPAFVRSAEHVVSATELRPFGPVAEGQTHMIAFCRSVPGVDIEQFDSDRDRFEVHGADVHWLIEGTLMDSKVTLKALGKALGQPCTTRNVSSLAKLADRLR